MDNTHNLFFKKGQDLLATRDPVFSYTEETFSSMTRKWSDVTLSSSWISSINAFCTTETSRELSATTAVPHSHCRPWEWVTSIPIFLLQAESSGLFPAFIRQMAGIKHWNYLHRTLIKVTLFSATMGVIFTISSPLFMIRAYATESNISISPPSGNNWIVCQTTMQRRVKRKKRVLR